MLLRSASSPLLNTARVPAAAAEHAAGHLAVLPPAGHRQGVLCRALSEADLLAPVPAARNPPAPAFAEDDEDAQEDEGNDDALRRLLTSAGLDLDLDAAGLDLDLGAAALALLEGVGGGGGGGRACRGGQGGRGGDGDGRGAADAHYRRMIAANPGNSLPLANYARFLREVEGDEARAREYCERAIVADPADADALALYAGLVWEATRDADRADAYYSRAVQAAPDDCYVLGSYAGFLWDAEEGADLTDDGQPPPATPPFCGAAQLQHPSVRTAS